MCGYPKRKKCGRHIYAIGEIKNPTIGILAGKVGSKTPNPQQ